MSVGPRVVFTRFLTRDSPKLNPWVEHRDRVIDIASVSLVPAIRDLADGAVAVVWQLVSANNRQLARSAQVHASFESAAGSAQQIVDMSAELVLTRASEQGRGMYGWYAAIENDPVMTCARWYTTDRDREQAGALAVTAIAVAQLGAGARLMDPALLRETR
jgi:hypothetical protein